MAESQNVDKEYLLRQLRKFKKEILDKEHPDWSESDKENKTFIENKPFFSRGMITEKITRNDFVSYPQYSIIVPEEKEDKPYPG